MSGDRDGAFGGCHSPALCEGGLSLSHGLCSFVGGGCGFGLGLGLGLGLRLGLGLGLGLGTPDVFDLSCDGLCVFDAGV